MLSKQKNKLIPLGLFIAILVVAAIILLNEQYWYFWTMIAVAGAIILGSNYKRTDPNKILTLLASLNIVFDSLAVAIWSVFPSTQWSIYQLGFPIVGTEAGVAASVFAFVLFGLIKKKKWAPFLAITLTITQRIFATYVFFPSKALLVTLMWTILIIYFAYKDIKSKPTLHQIET